MARFVLVGLLALLAGCATPRATASRTTSDGWTVLRIPAGGATREVAWKAGSPGSGWSPDSARTADFAWAHQDLPATIYGDSTCGRRYDDVPLTVLVNHLTFGFEDATTESQEDLELAGRAGLRRVFTATLDGIPVKIASTVVKKGPCIFDVVYLTAKPGRFDDQLPAYEEVVRGVTIREGR